MEEAIAHTVTCLKPVLQEMRVELLRECPLLCVHCSAHAAPHHTLQLPLNRVLSLIDEFVQSGGRQVTLTGGEPLMYSGLEDVLQKCHTGGLNTRLFSSGIIFDQGKHMSGYSRICQIASFIDRIMYSVYSSRTETHDLITRIPGSLQLTLSAIAHTVELGIEAEIHFVPTQVNYRELPDIVELAARLKVSHVGILRFVPHGRGKNKSHALTLGREEHIWLRDTVKLLRERYPQIAITVGSAYNLLHVNRPQNCSAGINQIVIEANGRIAPCSAFSNFHVDDQFGNILQQPLHIVWKQSLYLQKVRKALVESTHDCYGCLAQKTMVAGHIDVQSQDPLETLLS